MFHSPLDNICGNVVCTIRQQMIDLSSFKFQGMWRTKKKRLFVATTKNKRVHGSLVDFKAAVVKVCCGGGAPAAEDVLRLGLNRGR